MPALAAALTSTLAIRAEQAWLPGKPLQVCVGFSGGVDSTVLLHLLAKASAPLAPRVELTALHVHHGLSPHADHWAVHCQNVAAALHVPLQVARVQVQHNRATGPEAAARLARQQAFQASGAQLLALAHHADDQAETVLFRALRGATVASLAAMAEWAPAGRYGHCATQQLWRPLLAQPKAVLLRYAEQHNLSWITDESNANTDFTRNLLRGVVLPQVERHLPQARVALTALAQRARQAQGLLAELAREDRARTGLAVEALAALSAERLANLLHQWWADSGVFGVTERELLNVCAWLRAVPANGARQHVGPGQPYRLCVKRGMLELILLNKVKPF